MKRWQSIQSQIKEVRAYMNSLQLPDSFVNLAKELFVVFSCYGQPYFLVIVRGLLLCPQRKTITSCIRLGGVKNHFSCVHRFLSQYRWEPKLLALSLANLIIQKLGIDQLVLVIDDTLVAKWGKKIFGRCLHFDHSAKENDPKYLFGHNWVVIGLLYYTKTFSKWLCFALWASLYISKDKCPEERSFQTKIEIALQMLEAIKGALNLILTVVTDAMYIKAPVIKWAIVNQVTLMGRIRKDSVLYEPAPQRRRKGRGRPRKYGNRIKDFLGLPFKKATLRLYDKDVELRYHSVRAYYKSAQALVQILVVLYPDRIEPTLFLCTDLHQTPEDILKLIAARFKIEVTFQYLKEQGGLTHWQCRKEKAVTRSATLNTCALSLLILWSLLESNVVQPELWDYWPWYRQKDSISIPDMLRQLKAKSIERTIFTTLSPDKHKVKKIQALVNTLKLAA